MQDWMIASFLCYDLPQNPVFELRRRCINQNEAESVTLRYSLYIYLTSPRGLYVTSLNVVLALSFLHYVMQAPPPSYTMSYQRHRKMNSLHYPPPKIASSQCQRMFSQVVE